MNHRNLRVDESEIDRIVEQMTAIVESSEQGWINLAPWVDPAVAPQISVLRRMFTGRGPKVPEASWVPSSKRNDSSIAKTSAEIGILHSAGAKAKRSLADANVPIPTGARVVQDHSRRGLVLSVGSDLDLASQARFMIEAAKVLSGVPIGTEWVVRITTSS